MPGWTKDSLDEALADFLWSQWSQIGVFGQTDRRDRWAIDPEALCLFSLRFGPREPRLFGEVLDWMRANGRLLSAKRLRNLTRRERDRSLADAALAWAGMHNRQLQLWTTRTPDALVTSDLVPLGEVRVREPDPAFAAFGLSWPRTPPSGKSRVPDVTRPVAMAFRIRLVFGTGSRSESLRYLLTTGSPESTTTEVAEAAGFQKRIVHEALSELAESGTIRVRPKGRALAYSLDAGRWAAFLGIPSRAVPSHVDWLRLFSALWEMVRFFDEDAKADRSDYIRASEARVLVDRIRSDLLAAGVDLPDERGAYGEAYWPVFQAIVDASLQMLKTAA